MSQNKSIYLALGGKIGLDCMEIAKKKKIEIKGFSIRRNQYSPKQADYLISVQYNRIFSLTDIDMYKKAYNFHFSALPLNRGCLPINWAIWNKDPVAVTLHEIDKGIDTGNIIEQRFIEVEPKDTDYLVYLKCCLVCKQMFADRIEDLITENYNSY